MARDKRYQKLLNSRRWKELRAWKLAKNPLCERCAAEGYVVSAVDCHHIRSVLSATTQAEMERLCYDPANLMALCIPCHIKVHKEEGSGGRGGREAHKQRAEERLQRWVERQKKEINNHTTLQPTTQPPTTHPPTPSRRDGESEY